MELTEEVLRYPTGKFTAKESYTAEELANFAVRIGTLPDRVESALAGLKPAQLDTPYREGGWTLRQVAHHIADSHMNAYIRMKWTLTEDTPTIKTYDEKAWAKTPEVTSDPVLSLQLLKALHQKWIVLINGFSTEDHHRKFYHPDSKKFVRLDALMGLYAWHGDHHLAHITGLKERMGW